MSRQYTLVEGPSGYLAVTYVNNEKIPINQAEIVPIDYRLFLQHIESLCEIYEIDLEVYSNSEIFICVDWYLSRGVPGVFDLCHSEWFSMSADAWKCFLEDYRNPKIQESWSEFGF